MFIESVLGAGALAAGGVAVVRSRRQSLYRRLDSDIAKIQAASMPIRLRSAGADFSSKLTFINALLPQDVFGRLSREAMWLSGPERSYIPAHKKGGTIAYESIIAQAPAITALYHSRELQSLVSSITGVQVWPTPLNDQSSLSLLFYDKPGDHIGWHYDHNFYRGRHFTVLIALMNEGRAAGGLSHARLMARVNGQECNIATPPNRMVLFEGAAIHHKVTPIKEGEKRLMLSMTYCTDRRARWWRAGARRIKDTAFFGLRALWT